MFYIIYGGFRFWCYLMIYLILKSTWLLRKCELKGNIESAKNMLKKNLDIELILYCTGLSREKVEKLQCEII